MQNTPQKKIVLYDEITYLIATVTIAFAVAFVSASDVGLSMIVAPAYLLSQKLGFLTFGQCEYVVQGVEFILFCIIVKKFKFSYFFAFFSVLFYGALLDLVRMIPIFNPTEPLSLPLRILFYAVGVLLTCFGVMLHFKTYLFPQVVDFFVNGIVTAYRLPLGKFKSIFDLTMLAISLVMSYAFFGTLVGMGVGTFVSAVVNGPIIGLFSRLFDRYVERRRFFPVGSAVFSVDEVKPKKAVEDGQAS